MDSKLLASQALPAFFSLQFSPSLLATFLQAVWEPLLLLALIRSHPHTFLGISFSICAAFVGVYFVHVYMNDAQHTGDGAWRLWRQFLANVADYFPFRVEFDGGDSSMQELPNSKRLIAGCHPHGVFTFSLLAFALNLGPCRKPSFRGLAASVLFYTPVVREIMLWTGMVDASPATARRMLRSGHSLYIVVGGEKEVLYTEFGRERLVLNCRKGFIKLALQEGADLVPSYTFHLNDLYVTYNSVLPKIRKWIMTKFRVCLPIFTGWGYSILPFPRPLTTVVGAPIHVEKVSNPSQQQIEKLHSEYVKALRQLFDRHKSRFCCQDRVLEIVE